MPSRPINPSHGEDLRRWCRELRLSGKDLSRITGISHRHACSILSGKCGCQAPLWGLVRLLLKYRTRGGAILIPQVQPLTDPADFRTARVALGWTYETCGVAIGVCWNCVRAWEKGRNGIPPVVGNLMAYMVLDQIPETANRIRSNAEEPHEQVSDEEMDALIASQMPNLSTEP